jgi:sulfur relay protein TusB/DsrH
MIKNTLHLIFSLDGWQKTKPLLDSDDKVLFLQDAVYQLQANLAIEATSLYAREIDVTARNIKPTDNITIIDDNQWVELTTAAHNVISW